MRTRPTTPTLVSLALGLVLTVVLAECARAAPEIFSLDPETGPAGTPIVLKGKGLARTRHVAFAVGRSVKLARFWIVSDRELNLLAPEYFRAQAAATVAVFTPSGVTVAMPAAGQTIRAMDRAQKATEAGATLYHVMNGGVVAQASSVAVVEWGGVVQSGSTPGMHFINQGGTLVDYSNTNGIVFYEPGANFGPAIARSQYSLTLTPVPHITVSAGVGPFVYEKPPRPRLANVRVVPPQIDTFAPYAGAAGDIVKLTGRGFAQTTNVWIKEPSVPPRQTGFRIISDHTLRIEVPDDSGASGPALIMVATTAGLAVTVPDDRTIRPALFFGAAPRPEFAPVLWVAPGDVTRAPPGDVVFVDNDGCLVDAIGNSVLLIKRAGQVGGRLGRQSLVFYERGAVLPAHVRNARDAHEVPAIIPSIVPSPFAIFNASPFRR
jgi:hypothetical protein